MRPADIAKRIREDGLLKTSAGFASTALKLLSLNYYRLRARACPVWPGVDRQTLDDVERGLGRLGVEVRDLFVSVEEFEKFKRSFDFGGDFYGGPGSTHFNEKVLEHFISYSLAVSRMDKKGVYIDVAACDSPWAKLLRERGYGGACAIDLAPSVKYSGLDYYMTMDATKTAFSGGGVSAASLHCAFEMFLHDGDTRLIRELGRILKKGGRAVIAPLYMNVFHAGFSSPEYYFKKRYHDAGARVFIAHDGMTGIPFARFYDPERLKTRVLDAIEGCGMGYVLYRLRDAQKIDGRIYCAFVLEVLN